MMADFIRCGACGYKRTKMAWALENGECPVCQRKRELTQPSPPPPDWRGISDRLADSLKSYLSPSVLKNTARIRDALAAYESARGTP
jgi:hypothetical protein